MPAPPSGSQLNLFILLVAFAGITGMPQLFLRDKYPKPAYVISAGGALQLLRQLWQWLGPSDIYLPGSLVTAISLVLIFSGLVWVLDLRFPTRGYLPRTLTEHRTVDRSELFFPGFIAFFVVGYLLLAIFAPHTMPGGAAWYRIGNCLAMIVLLAAWVYFRRNYIALHWVLQRRPEAVCWVFVQSTRVTRNGVYQGTYWSTQVGLEDGQLLALTTNQQAAEQIAAEVAHVCPQAALGFSDATRAQFNRDPKSVRRTALPPPA